MPGSRATVGVQPSLEPGDEVIVREPYAIAPATPAPAVKAGNMTSAVGRRQRRLRPFSQIAAELKRQADQLAERAQHTEECGARIGLSSISLSRAIFDLREQAELVSDAHRLVDALVPAEQTILGVIGEAA